MALIFAAWRQHVCSEAASFDLPIHVLGNVVFELERYLDAGLAPEQREDLCTERCASVR